jgi:predicted enzyme related to lactoylglutathione lyase
MLKNLLVVGIPVSNQDEAIDFYVNKLGFEKRTDVPMGEGRWIEVAPPGAQTTLVLAKGACGELQDRIGKFTGYIFATDDIQTTYEMLKSRGVHFTELPRVEPWGKWAQFVDQDGNGFGLKE